MDNILVAIDFSDATDRLYECAVQTAGSCNAKVHFLHVEDPDPEFVGLSVGPEYVRDQANEHHQTAAQRLKELENKAKRAGLSATSHLEQGPIIESILHFSDRIKADLIVIGSHGHGAIYSTILGSVSEEILHSTDRPVLVVPIRP